MPYKISDTHNRKNTQDDFPRPILLYGITASGKTYIYVTIIKQLLENGKGAIQQSILKAGGKVTNQDNQADVTLIFKFNVTDLGRSNDFYTSKCETIVSVQSKNREVNFQKNLPPEKGVHLNAENAREKAIENSIEQINYRWFQGLILDICK